MSCAASWARFWLAPTVHCRWGVGGRSGASTGRGAARCLAGAAPRASQVPQPQLSPPFPTPRGQGWDWTASEALRTPYDWNLLYLLPTYARVRPALEEIPGLDV